MSYGSRPCALGRWFRNCQGNGRLDLKKNVTKWRRLAERRGLRDVMDGVADGDNIPTKPSYCGYP